MPASDAKVALVTGGSGALGGAIVRRLRRDGLEVVFTFNAHEKEAGELAESSGAVAFRADLTDRAQVRAMVKGALDRFGRIDVLVNNAGLTQVMPFALIEEEDWDRVLDANLKSMFLVTREVVRGMIARKSGVIVNIGSLAGHRLLEVPVHYATAKAGVSGFTLALAGELSRYKIRVNSVVPGLLEAGVGRMVPEKEMADYLRHCAAGRPGRMDEVAEVVAFLASDAAAYVNAQSIFVDGGI
ncbi:MAG TPA: SDR family NAD(P)-dependent oxidoreductase [Planctomycetota bacterium]|nr:SDR family NAD(P)-dependent oxidoreductase [Planctomycetota bacterium]